tara:strand:+ start:2123 stop:2326 length:204 start_codon:yes stop_codon:yes gene_type:complete
MIGDDAKIVILGVKGSQIRLGIDAPKNVIVHREEIYSKIKDDKDNKKDKLSSNSDDETSTDIEVTQE